jgi:hypothetical protein
MAHIYISLLLLKCTNLHIDSNRSTVITEPNTGATKIKFLEKHSLTIGFWTMPISMKIARTHTSHHHWYISSRSF